MRVLIDRPARGQLEADPFTTARLHALVGQGYLELVAVDGEAGAIATRAAAEADALVAAQRRTRSAAERASERLSVWRPRGDHGMGGAAAAGLGRAPRRDGRTSEHSLRLESTPPRHG